MTLAEELLDQAGYLVRREPKHPKQASLRRAVSTAYYALFHFVIDMAVERLATDQGLQLLIRRAFSHTEMSKAASSLSSGGPLPKHVAAVFSGSIPTELRQVAETFVDLQKARHDADYNLSLTFTRQEVAEWIDQVRSAFNDWRTLAARPADKPAVELFLAGMLLWERWGKG